MQQLALPVIHFHGNLFAVTSKVIAFVRQRPGVLNVVNSDGANVETVLSSHFRIKHRSFTGSPEVGKRIGEVCVRNLVPCKMELGGIGAAVVFDDVDVNSVATQLAGAITLNTGQVCCTATRRIAVKNLFMRTSMQDDYAS